VSTVALPAPGTTRSARAVGTVTRATIWRRRVVAVATLVLLAFLLTVAIGRVGAGAELEDRVAGHVVVAPGETLWDVAVATAPDGVDVRRHLADVKELNGLSGGDVAAWTVILLPAR
jgi:hypothetical protein